jgi:hypothetical protein
LGLTIFLAAVVMPLAVSLLARSWWWPVLCAAVAVASVSAGGIASDLILRRLYAEFGQQEFA